MHGEWKPNQSNPLNLIHSLPSRLISTDSSITSSLESHSNTTHCKLRVCMFHSRIDCIFHPFERMKYFYRKNEIFLSKEWNISIKRMKYIFQTSIKFQYNNFNKKIFVSQFVDHHLISTCICRCTFDYNSIYICMYVFEHDECLSVRICMCSWTTKRKIVTFDTYVCIELKKSNIIECTLCDSDVRMFRILQQ